MQASDSRQVIGRVFPPVFLDRDGTLIVEKDYLSDPDQVYLEAGVVDGLRHLHAAGFPLIVITNQSGIGRGKFTVEQARAVNSRLAQLLQECGIRIAGWYLCPHTPDENCECRKPRPGLAHTAAADMTFDLRGSFVIGDKRSDLEMADAIEATGLLVATGHGNASLAWARASGRLIFDNFLQAADYICDRLNTDSESTTK